MDYQKNGFVRVFFQAFDGQSESLGQLTPTQRWVWVALLAFSRLHLPHGWLNDGGTEHKPHGTNQRRLAQWCNVGRATLQRTLKRCCELDMLKLDRRRDPECYQILNWDKWQCDMNVARSGPLTEDGGPKRATAAQSGPVSASERAKSASKRATLSDDSEWPKAGRDPQEILVPQGEIPIAFDDEEWPAPGQADSQRREERLENGREVQRTPPILQNQDGISSPDLTDQCLSALGDLAEQGGARVTVENVIASHPHAAEVVLAECIALKARLDEGQRVHLSFLARNVVEACRRVVSERERDAEKARQAEEERDDGAAYAQTSLRRTAEMLAETPEDVARYDAMMRQADAEMRAMPDGEDR